MIIVSQNDKRVKGLGGFGLLGLLLVVGGLYLYHHHTAETVQERIYVVPERSESPAVQPEPAFQSAPVHTATTSAAAVSYDEDLSAADDHDYESDAFSDRADVFLTEISEDPVLSESTFDPAAAEEARIVEIGLRIEKLTEATTKNIPNSLSLRISRGRNGGVESSRAVGAWKNRERSTKGVSKGVSWAFFTAAINRAHRCVSLCLMTISRGTGTGDSEHNHEGSSFTIG